MRFLFVVQGEGRGHLTQALSLADIIRKEGHELVKVMVGKSKRRSIPDFFIKQIQCPVIPFDSPNFLPSDKAKKAPLIKSVIYNLSRVINYSNSILLLNNEINNNDIDIVINFYELLTGITNALFYPTPKVISIAHQYLFLHKDYKFPNANRSELFFLKLFTQCTALRSDKKLALSFKAFSADSDNGIEIIPPLLRQKIFSLKPIKGNYILGYMVNNGYAEEITTWQREFSNTQVHLFWDRKQNKEVVNTQENLYFHRINDITFLQHLNNAEAYVSTAGFESICEAIYLGKKLMVVPSHIEQQCNAHEVESYGFGVQANTFNLSLLNNFIHNTDITHTFKNWVDQHSDIIMRHIYNTRRIETKTQQRTIYRYFSGKHNTVFKHSS
ncbi:MAG: glycosyltransferase family protein [Marinifilaceae bacterium]